MEIKDIKTLQNKILDIAVYFDEFCKKNNIEYYLMGGSALGAIRHKGFIPWDDDLDIFMTYGNYRKFLNVASEELDVTRFYLQKENTSEWPLFFSKLRMNGTTYIEEDTKNLKIHKGFYIDIMCLNNVSKNKIYRYLQYISARIITAKTLDKRGYVTNSSIKKIAMFCARVIVRGILKKFLIWFVRSLNNRTTKYVGHLFGRARFRNTSFPEYFLGAPRYVPFESVEFPVIEHVEKYLALRYGSTFMELPNEETKSKYPSHVVFYDTEKDFTEYDGKKF